VAVSAWLPVSQMLKHLTYSHENVHEHCAIEVHPNAILPNLLLPAITRWRTREIERQEGD